MNTIEEILPKEFPTASWLQVSTALGRWLTATKQGNKPP